MPLTDIGYVFAGTIMSIIGVALIVITFDKPIINILTTVIGWTLIVLGGMVAMYGVIPETALMIFFGASAIIYIAGMAYILYYVIRGMRQVEVVK